MKFWKAMREMQENGKKVRCKRWNRPREKDLYWQLGDDCRLPTAFEWEDAMEEWELYEKPQKTHTFAEVVKGLKEGKKFVREGHASDLALFIMGDGIYPRTKYGIANLTMEELAAEDWIEVK